MEAFLHPRQFLGEGLGDCLDDVVTVARQGAYIAGCCCSAHRRPLKSLIARIGLSLYRTARCTLYSCTCRQRSRSAPQHTLYRYCKKLFE